MSTWFETHWWGIQLCAVALVLLIRVQITTKRTLILKRLAVWLLETLSEALLLSLLIIFWARVSYGPDNQWGYAKGLLFFFIATAVVFMFASGYLLTTAMFGVVWRSQRFWLYPTIAAVLYLGHLRFAFGSDHWSLGHWDLSERVALQVGGACIVFACTFVGGRLLRKWGARVDTPLEIDDVRIAPNPYTRVDE